MTKSRAHKLEELIAQRFPAEGREERIERAVRAVREFCGSFAGKVSEEQLRRICEADLFDEDDED
jgi:hypothetical protein